MPSVLLDNTQGRAIAKIDLEPEFIRDAVITALNKVYAQDFTNCLGHALRRQDVSYSAFYNNVDEDGLVRLMVESRP